METAHLLIGILLYALGFLSNRLITSYVSKKGENLATKEDIAEITNKIEAVKNQFYEHQTQYSLFHQKRFEVLGKIYELINDPYEHALNMLHPYQSDGSKEAEDVRRNKTVDSFNELSGYFHKHRIYLSEEMAQEVAALTQLMKTCIHNYFHARDTDGIDTELWNESYKAIKDKVPELRNRLEAMFRSEIFTKSYKETLN